MTQTTVRLRIPVAFAFSAIGYVVAEKLQWLMFSIGPSLKPIYDQLEKHGVLALFFVWFLLLAVVASTVIAWLLSWVWRKLGHALSARTLALIGVATAVVWECIDQWRLARFEEFWTLSVLNMQRIALILAFPVMLAWVCSRGPNKALQGSR